MDQKLKEAIYGLRLCLPVDCQSMPSGFSFRKWADVKRGQKLYRQFYQTLHQELRSKNFHIFPSMFFDIPGMASYKLGLAESSPELLEDCSHVAKELDALGCLWRRFCGAWLVTGSWPEVQCSFLVTKRFNEEHPIIHGKIRGIKWWRVLLKYKLTVKKPYVGIYTNQLAKNILRLLVWTCLSK